MPSSTPVPPSTAKIVVRVASSVALIAIALWLGGLLTLGALVAPVVFSMVPLPASADAMVVVFLRFDTVAMTCAALVLCAEAARRMSRTRLPWVDVARASLSVAAAAAAVFEGTRVSPRIAELHASGAIRGLGDAGMDLSRMHDVAEACGKTQALLLVVLVVLHVVSLSSEANAADTSGKPAKRADKAAHKADKGGAASSERHERTPEGAASR
jgi:hypothetical protein